MVRGAWYDEVIAKRRGRDDRTLRFVAGVALAVVGLFVLGGGRVEVGNAALAGALLLLLTSLTRVCPGYVPFGISTVSWHACPAPRDSRSGFATTSTEMRLRYSRRPAGR